MVVLAAGESRRLGEPKQLLRYHGETLLRRAARTAVEAAVGPVVVVIAAGPGAPAMRGELAGLGVRVAENRQAVKGLSTSVRAGLEALGRAGVPAARAPAAASATDRPLEATLFLTCDQPLVTAAVLRELVAAWRAGRPSAVASEYGGAVGVPALFARSLFEELRALGGEAGAKRVLQRHAGEVVKVPFPGGELDVDSPEDLQRLR